MKHQLGYICFVIFLLFDSTFEQEERLALLQLRSSLGLRAKDWPIKGNPCLNWRGITCKNGRVTEINISGFKRTRTGSQNPQFLVDALQNCTLLESFNASNFSLPASIPQWFGISLASLQVLDLSFCSITGAIPSTLGNLSKLAFLYISNNGLTGMVPSSLSQLESLLVLDLSHNSLVGSIPASFASLGNLTLLDMSSNLLSGAISPVIGNGAVKLKFLNLSQNMFYGNLPPVIRRFSFLDLSGNYFQGKVPEYHGQSNFSLNRNCLQRLESQRDTSECASFYDEHGLVFDNFGEPNAMELPAPKSDKTSHKNVIISAAVLGSVGFVATVIIFVVLLICCCKRGTTNQRVTGVEPVPTSASPPPPPGASLKFSSLGVAFNYQQILQTTGDFSEANLIKHGHSGDIFRGILEGGIHVVIKRIDSSSVKKEAYLLELDLFSKVSHSRLVPLLGHCLESENEKFLVYKYIPNGDLSSSLFRKTNSDDSLQSLDWITRLKIAIGAAQGLSYLHHECNPSLVHRDVQASSILLDDKFEVRLGSLNEVCAQGDTHQNRISWLLRLPQTSEQGASGMLNATCAYDVYCFGKVLLELVTGKLGISASSDATMKEWLDKTLPCISINDKELVTNIIDPSLIVDDDLLEEVWVMAVVARSCLNPKPSRRPLMRYILKALENPLKVVREEHTTSERLRVTSPRGSWNATLFGSWRHSFSDVVALAAVAPANQVEGATSFKKSATTGSQGSGQIAEGAHSFSTRRHSKEIFPEPLDVQDAERTRDE